MDKNYFLCRKNYEGKTQLNEIKGYVHFDLKSSLNDNWNYVTNTQNVETHAFFPFIHYKQVFKRFDKEAILKYKIKERDIFYSSHLDRCIYTYYGANLNEKYNKKIKDEKFDDAVLAYRTDLSGKCNIDFAYDAFNIIKQLKDCYIFIGDFKSFFDELNHEYLKKQIASLLEVERLPKDYFAVYKSITKFSYVELGSLIFNSCYGNPTCYKKTPTSKNREGYICQLKKHLCNRNVFLKENGVNCDSIDKYACGYRPNDSAVEWKRGECLNRKCRHLFNSQKRIKLDQIRKAKIIKSNTKNKGIPQGSAISAILANIYMLEFDRDMSKFIKENGGKYMRYSDDFIVILPYSETFKMQYNEIKNIQSNTKNLILEGKKTRIYRFNEDRVLCCTPDFVSDSALEKNVIEYLGFAFDGKSVNLRDKTISKYYYRAYRKIKTILKDREHFKGLKVVGTSQLYLKYSIVGAQGYKDPKTGKYKSGNFITYVNRAAKVFKDSESINLVAKKHMTKIYKRLKNTKGSNIETNSIH